MVKYKKCTLSHICVMRNDGFKSRFLNNVMRWCLLWSTHSWVGRECDKPLPGMQYGVVILCQAVSCRGLLQMKRADVVLPRSYDTPVYIVAQNILPS